jgi:hypothetical protein
MTIEEILEVIKGYGSDDQPLTIGILKAILNELQIKEYRKP